MVQNTKKREKFWTISQIIYFIYQLNILTVITLLARLSTLQIIHNFDWALKYFIYVTRKNKYKTKIICFYVQLKDSVSITK